LLSSGLASVNVVSMIEFANGGGGLFVEFSGFDPEVSCDGVPVGVELCPA